MAALAQANVDEPAGVASGRAGEEQLPPDAEDEGVGREPSAIEAVAETTSSGWRPGSAARSGGPARAVSQEASRVATLFLDSHARAEARSAAVLASSGDMPAARFSSTCDSM